MLNKVMLIGRVGRDPEVRYTTDGRPVASFSIATSKTYKDKNGEKQEKTEWHNIVVWGRSGEFAGEHCKKGSLVYLEGEIQSREYDDRDGNKRKIYEINARDLQMLTWPDRGGASAGSSPGGRSRQEPARKPREDDDFIPELDDDVPM